MEKHETIRDKIQKITEIQNAKYKSQLISKVPEKRKRQFTSLQAHGMKDLIIAYRCCRQRVESDRLSISGLLVRIAVIGL